MALTFGVILGRFIVFLGLYIHIKGWTSIRLIQKLLNLQRQLQFGKRKEDGFNVVLLSFIYIYNSSFGPPCVIYELSHGSRYHPWRWPSRVHQSYIIKFQVAHCVNKPWITNIYLGIWLLHLHWSFILNPRSMIFWLLPSSWKYEFRLMQGNIIGQRNFNLVLNCYQFSKVFFLVSQFVQVNKIYILWRILSNFHD